LTDPFKGIARCIEHALSELGLPVPDKHALRPWIGPPLLESFAAWFEYLGVSASPRQALALYRERFAGTGLYENEVYPGIPDVLRQLSDHGYRLILATAKPGVFARPIVDHFGLDRWLAGVYGSELDGRRTDKVELLQFILEREALEPGQCVMIGDREHDMRAARYHGMGAIGVLWGYGSDRELLDSGADRLVTEPQQLTTILDGSGIS
jgi:phosphoglycolate phosphatase